MIESAEKSTLPALWEVHGGEGRAMCFLLPLLQKEDHSCSYIQQALTPGSYARYLGRNGHIRLIH